MRLTNRTIFIFALILIGSGLFSFYFSHSSSRNPYRYQFPISVAQKQNLTDDIAFYEKRVQRDPDGAFDPATLAELYVSQGKASGDPTSFDNAEKYAELSLKNRTASNASAVLVLADVAQAKHQFARAIELALKLRQDRPGAAEVLPILITSYLAVGDLKNASLIANDLVDEGPNANAHALRALVDEAQGREREAIFDYTRAIRLEEADDFRQAAWVRCLFARFDLDRGKFSDAKMLLSEALRIVPNDPMALGLTARLAEEKGDTAIAERLYRQAFEKSKQIPFLLGEARALLVRDRASGEELRKQAEILVRTELTEKGFGHRSELIRLLLERNGPGDAKEAVSVAEEEVKARPNSESFHLLAWSELLNSNIQGAKVAIRTALLSGVRRAEVYQHAGMIAAVDKKSEEAKFYFDLARSMSPNLRFSTINTSSWPSWLASQ
jgi:tetratricopeptide (TPR) repeat protein